MIMEIMNKVTPADVRAARQALKSAGIAATVRRKLARFLRVRTSELMDILPVLDALEALGFRPEYRQNPIQDGDQFYFTKGKSP